MLWNLKDIQFLFQPDVFAGTFSNPKMQARHEAMQKEKIASLKKQLQQTSDPLEALLILHKDDHTNFLRSNKSLFVAAGEFEEAVLRLYFRKNTPFFTDGSFDTWLDLFRECDPERLMAKGTPLPSSAVTCYRGSVTGVAKGLCWTLDHQYVQKILDSWADPDLGGGTVFSETFSDQDIIYHVDDGKRHEIILRPDLASTPAGKPIKTLA